MRRYKRLMLNRLAPCLAVAGALVFAAPAAAQDNLDRIQVGYPGTVTRQFATSLSLAMTIPSVFRRDCCYDFQSGAWVGPDVRYPSGRTTQSRVAWEVSFTRTSRSAKSVAQAAGWGNYPQVAVRKRTVRHVLGGNALGKIKAYSTVDQEAAPFAKTQAALTVDLGKKVKATILWTFENPDSDTDASGGAVTVNGLSSRAWNRRAAELALKSVALEGALPISKVKARASGRTVSGKVLDIAGQGVGQAKLVLQRRAGGGWRKAVTGKSKLTGAFSLRAPGSGQYRVVASFGAASARSKAVRVK
jgi:hypothetical protein